MSTSLVSQLNALSVQSVAAKPDDVSFGRTSLIFTGEYAASIDKATVFHLAETGLSELIQTNASFQNYRNSLFGVDSHHLERTVAGSDVNKELDEVIEEFLVLLTPYVQRNGALKALEWLIQSFQIQKFNVDQFLFAFLPFHETKLFIRVVQVVDPRAETHAWHWLQDMQRADHIVTKGQLHKYFHRHLSMLASLTAFVIRLNRVHSEKDCAYYNSFFLATCLGCLDVKKELSETDVTSIMSMMRKCVSSKNRQLQNVALSVFCVMLQKVQIEGEPLKKLLSSLVSRMLPELVDELMLFTISTMAVQQELELTSLFASSLFEKYDKSPSALEFGLLTSACYKHVTALIIKTIESQNFDIVQSATFSHFVSSFVSHLKQESGNEKSCRNLFRTVIPLLITQNCVQSLNFLSLLAERYPNDAQNVLNELKDSEKVDSELMKQFLTSCDSDKSSSVLRMMHYGTSGSYNNLLKLLKNCEDVEIDAVLNFRVIRCLQQNSLEKCAELLCVILSRNLIKFIGRDELVDVLWQRCFDAFLTSCE